MEKTVRFSIIIPLYNKANYIEKTLQSVLNQTYPEFEVLVINDGSTDNSLKVVKQINDYRVKIFSKENEGVSATRNFGIEKAQHDYIAFLDADDLWLPDYLDAICKLIQFYPNAGVFATLYYVNKKIDGSDFELKKETSNFGDTILIVDYCKDLIERIVTPLWTGSICVNKKCFVDSGSFPIGVKRGEDLDMWLRLSLNTSIAVLNSQLVIYNQITENNATRNYESYKESFPYWKWYSYSKSRYIAKYATIKILDLMIVALNNKAYKDVIVLFFKIKGFYFIRRRLLLLFEACLQMLRVFIV